MNALSCSASFVSYFVKRGGDLFRRLLPIAKTPSREGAKEDKEPKLFFAAWRLRAFAFESIACLRVSAWSNG